MREFLEGLQQTFADLLLRWQEISAGWPWWPELLPWLVALVLLLALFTLRRRRPAALTVQPPALLITQGEVVLPGPVAERSRRGASPAAARSGTLSMTLSNLSRYPVQVLEVALRPARTAPPRVATVEALVPALAAAEVSVEVPLQLTGDSWLEVYCYAAAPRRKLHRHRAELVWEPWMQRFKVAPMDQLTAPVRRLASAESRAILEIPAPTPKPKPVAAPTPSRRAPTPPAPGLKRPMQAAVPPATDPPVVAPPAAPPPVAAPPVAPPVAAPPVATPVAPPVAAPPVAALPVADAPVADPPEADPSEIPRRKRNLAFPDEF